MVAELALGLGIISAAMIGAIFIMGVFFSGINLNAVYVIG